MPPRINVASLSFASEYDPKEMESQQIVVNSAIIRSGHKESVDSQRLGGDGADSPIVCAHTKAF